VYVVHAGSVWSLLSWRLGERIGSPEPDRAHLQRVPDDTVDCSVQLVDADPPSAGLTLGLGPDMPDLPGCPGLLHGGHDVFGSVGHPGVTDLSCCGGMAERGVEHPVDVLRVTETVNSLGAPDGALVGLGAWLVLGGASLQRCLLGKRQRPPPWSAAGNDRPGSS